MHHRARASRLICFARRNHQSPESRFVPTAREQLIADWQNRLASASDIREESPSRSAWLSRLRIRLYQFLLSLYGDGQWRAPSKTATDSSKSHDVVIEPGVLPLAGKPAKDDSKIRATLESVASAREHPAELGPLAAGFGRDAWVIIASAGGGIDPQLCADALKAKGIIPRLVGRYEDVTVEVLAQHAAVAAKLITSQRGKLLGPRPVRRLPPPPPVLNVQSVAREHAVGAWNDTAAVIMVSAFIAFPVAWLILGIVAPMRLPHGLHSYFRGDLYRNQPLALGAVVCLLMLQIVFFQRLRIRRAAKGRESKQSGLDV